MECTDVAKGSRAAVWNPSQYIPSVILSSKAVEAMPKSICEADKLRWIPVDICAMIVLEILHEDETVNRSKLGIFNLANTQDAAGIERTWSDDVVPVLKSLLQSGPEQPLTVFEMTEWLELVEQHGPRKDNPAFRLLDFYHRLSALHSNIGLGGKIDVEHTKARSETFRELTAVKDEWLVHWVGTWNL